MTKTSIYKLLAFCIIYLFSLKILLWNNKERLTGSEYSQD